MGLSVTMNYFSYRLLTSLALPFIALGAWKRCRKHKKLFQAQTNVSEKGETATSTQPVLPEIPYCFRSRFGLNPTPMQKSGIWIHAVSVGETRSIFPLLKELKQTYPELPITITNSSLQGAIHSYQFCPITFQHQMLPLDYPGSIQRFLTQLQPKLVILVETEIWPVLYKQCAQHKIPLVLINGRLKNKSLRAYQKWGGKLITDALNQTRWIAAQSADDAANFVKLGADKQRVKVLGNLKSDIQIPTDLNSLSQQWLKENQALQRPIWVAASTHADPNNNASEESLIVKAHQQLLQQQPDALLIIVPRHAQRFNEVAELLQQSGLSWQRRSHNHKLNPQNSVYLADTLGEMLLWYSVAKVAFIGGSLVPFGGHNILEPAALKTPIISGANYANLAAMFKPFIDHDAIRIVHSETELADQILTLFADTKKAADLSTAAYQLMHQQTGALAKTVTEIKALLD